MPSALTTTTPCAGSVVLLQTLPPSPLGVSLVARLPLNGVSSTGAKLSATATGASLAGATVSVTVAVLALPSTVGHRVGEAVRAAVVGRRGVGEGAVGIDHHDAVRRIGGFAPDVAAVAARCRRSLARLPLNGVSSTGAKLSATATGASLTGVTVSVTVAVLALPSAVGHRVGEAVRAAVVGRRGVGEGAVGIDHHDAVRRIGGFAPDVAAVADRRVVARQGAAERRVLDRREAVRHRHRRVVGRRHGQRHGRRAGAAVSVGHRVGEAVRRRCSWPPGCR